MKFIKRQLLLFTIFICSSMVFFHRLQSIDDESTNYVQHLYVDNDYMLRAQGSVARRSGNYTSAPLGEATQPLELGAKLGQIRPIPPSAQLSGGRDEGKLAEGERGEANLADKHVRPVIRNSASDLSNSASKRDTDRSLHADNKDSRNIKGSAEIDYVPRGRAVTCPGLKQRPLNVRNRQRFYPVDGSRTMYVFSAILDRAERLVRVVGLRHTKNRPDKVYCYLWREGEGEGEDLSEVVATVSNLKEHKGRVYSAAYIECPLKDVRDPYAVTLSFQSCNTNTSVTQQSPVLPVLKAQGLANNFTICVKPLNFYYSRAYELVEFIELNRLFGADKFVFYVYSAGANVAQVLRLYERAGIVEVVDWKLPQHIVVRHWPIVQGQQEEIHAFGQLASSNDCLHRHRGLSRYVIAKDLDEFIVPKKHDNWLDMLADIDGENKQPSAAYIFRNVFFRKDWGVTEQNFRGRELAQKFRSVVLLYDKREEPLAPSTRTKYLVDPKRVQTIGIHNVWTLRGQDKARKTNVNLSHGLLHHYRSWEKPEDRKRAIQDLDIFRFKDRLLARLQERWAELPDVPLDVPQEELIEKHGQL